jgi:magnesium-transporting ATPase (P-type)
MKITKHAQRLGEENWHVMAEYDVFSELNSSPDGLDEEEIIHRQQIYGPNTLPAKKPLTIWAILLHQVMNPLIFILIAAAIASLAIGEYVDALFILVVIGLNSGLGAYQEYNAEKSAASLQNLIKINASVRRNRTELEIPAEELVPGDIVLLQSGDKVPADIRLFRVNNLAADESFLTGESLASEKRIGSLAEDTPVSERKNIVFAGSTITNGRGEGIVTGIGIETQVGMIASHVAQAESAKPPLVQRMEKFTKHISILVILIGIALAILLRFQGMGASSIFFFVVALAVSAIPEGLPVALTVTLSIAATKMAKRNVIVRKLNSVESLGSCTIIASDKTGTLTINRQTSRKITLPDGAVFLIAGEGYGADANITTPDGSRIDETMWVSLKKLATLSALTNEASLIQENGEWKQRGDAIDVAFLAMGYKMGLDPMKVKQELKKTGEIPYDSEHKFSAIFYEDNGKYHVAAKGAVETIMDFCTHMQGAYKPVELDRQKIEQQALQMAEEGLRVLAVAGGEYTGPEDKESYDASDLKGLVFYGLAGFIDPLRPEAIDSVNKCKQAGIKVVMITGDHPATAGAIARELKLSDREELVVTGQQLSESGTPDSPAFQKLVLSSHVFARVSPTQKLEIVDVLIRQGEFVAVTGDGVNDTPALRRANIGVAMGSGTDAAKEVGSMIVVDDNFSSIVSGIEEGRFAYDNVRKVTYLLISTGAAEVILFVTAIFAGLPLPMLAVQLLWLNLVTNGIQDVALAFEGGEPGAMKRKPRKPEEKMFDPQMLNQTLVSGLAMGTITFVSWFWLIKVQMMDEASARNIILLLFVFLQNLHVFNCRSENVSAFKIPISRNYILVFGVILAQGIHILSMHLPFMQNLLRINPISFAQWLVLLLLAFIILFIMEGFKLIRKKGC